jgi:dTDP-4-dehydrorhamnose reductase
LQTKTPKILVTGSAGMLGSDLCDIFSRKFETLGVDRRTAKAPPELCRRLDLTDSDRTREFFSCERPRIVLHTAAMTNVDECEKDRALACQMNVEMTRTVAEAAAQVGALLVFFSSDYVFDGKSSAPYAEDHPTNPGNVYGQTKAVAEELIQKTGGPYLILRISWLFGPGGVSFPRTILEKAAMVESFQVVEDQVGRPTYTRDLARALLELFSNFSANLPIISRQTFHLANSGSTSWADFAECVLENSHGKKPPVRRIATPEGHRPAVRPKFSVLSTKKAESVLGIRLRSWQDAVKDFIRIYESEANQHVESN